MDIKLLKLAAFYPFKLYFWTVFNAIYIFQSASDKMKYLVRLIIIFYA